MATIGEIRILVRDRLDEDSPRRWTNTQLDRWIEEAARDIARRSECLHKYGTVAVSANTQNVSLSTLTGLLKINKVEWQTTGDTSIRGLEYRDINGMDSIWWDGQAQAKSQPLYYTLIGNPPSLTVMVYPTPSQPGTLRVYYWHLPAVRQSSDSDAFVIEVPDGWHDLIADYAEYKALRKDADPRWKEAYDIYKDNLAAIVDQTRSYTDALNVIGMDAPGLAQWVWDDTWVG